MMQDDIPHIEAQCAECGFLFDMKWGLDCPACHHTGVRWARLVTEQEAQARPQLRAALDRITEWKREVHRQGCVKDAQYWEEDRLATKFERESIAECEAIYALDSTGSKT